MIAKQMCVSLTEGVFWLNDIQIDIWYRAQNVWKDRGVLEEAQENDLKTQNTWPISL